MISYAKKFLCIAVLIAAVLSTEAATMTKEKLLADRSKRVVQLEFAMAQVQNQLDNHESGVKRLDDQRLKSLKKRLHSYKGQIYDNSKTLSDEEIDTLLDKHSMLVGEL